jgi:uncharacterized protein with ParB-like and HNH nuclease domain
MVSDGDILLNPDYQRDYIYKNNQASALIESVLMDIPIPVIYLSEEEDGVYSVIDGQQRVTSFTNYLNNKFKLTQLEVYDELNGKNFESLPKDIQRKIKSSTLKCVCLKKECKDLKYEIFSRLNRGAVKLTPQELRNCLFRGNFNNMLHELSKNPLLEKMFREKNSRMKYEEYILRFFTVTEFHQYKKSMIQTLNHYMDTNKNISDTEVKVKSFKILNLLNLINTVLGEYAFCGYTFGKESKSPKFNAPIYDSIIAAFSMFDESDILKNKIKIKTAIENIKINDNEYRNFTFAGTSSRIMIIGRIMKIYFAMCEIIGNMGIKERVDLILPEIKRYIMNKYITCSYCGNSFNSIDSIDIKLVENKTKKKYDIHIHHNMC